MPLDPFIFGLLDDVCEHVDFFLALFLVSIPRLAFSAAPSRNGRSLRLLVSHFFHGLQFSLPLVWHFLLLGSFAFLGLNGKAQSLLLLLHSLSEEPVLENFVDVE